MTDLESFKLVNKCETFKELADTIISIGKDKGGIIKGRSKSKRAKQQALYVLDFLNLSTTDFLTRNYGIRQQAIYIAYYENLENVVKNNNSCEP